jgi:hypothetical protein
MIHYLHQMKMATPRLSDMAEYERILSRVSLVPTTVKHEHCKAIFSTISKNFKIQREKKAMKDHAE